LRLAYTAAMRTTRLLLQLMLAALPALAGCGQTGALYLPDEGVATPVEIRTTTTTEPAATPTPTPPPKPDDEDKKSDQPPGR